MMASSSDGVASPYGWRSDAFSSTTRSELSEDNVERRPSIAAESTRYVFGATICQLPELVLSSLSLALSRTTASAFFFLISSLRISDCFNVRIFGGELTAASGVLAADWR